VSRRTVINIAALTKEAPAFTRTANQEMEARVEQREHREMMNRFRLRGCLQVFHKVPDTQPQGRCDLAEARD
jgi:hypothetical protein